MKSYFIYLLFNFWEIFSSYWQKFKFWNISSLGLADITIGGLKAKISNSYPMIIFSFESSSKMCLHIYTNQALIYSTRTGVTYKNGSSIRRKVDSESWVQNIWTDLFLWDIKAGYYLRFVFNFIPMGLGATMEATTHTRLFLCMEQKLWKCCYKDVSPERSKVKPNLAK